MLSSKMYVDSITKNRLEIFFKFSFYHLYKRGRVMIGQAQGEV